MKTLFKVYLIGLNDNYYLDTYFNLSALQLADKVTQGGYHGELLVEEYRYTSDHNNCVKGCTWILQLANINQLLVA